MADRMNAAWRGMRIQWLIIGLKHVITGFYPTSGYVWVSKHSFTERADEGLILGSLGQHYNLLRIPQDTNL